MPPPPHIPLVLTSARLADDREVDVTIVDGVIVSVEPASTRASAASPTKLSAPNQGGRVLDLSGMMLLPAPAEPHAHLDKALLANRVRNESEDLPGAIDAIVSAYATMTDDDLVARSTEAIAIAISRGFTAIRTHLDCRVGIGTRSVRRLVEVKQQLADLIDLQIVALAGYITDGAEGNENRRLLIESLSAGADLVGGTPSLEPDPIAATRDFVAVAAEYGVGMDLHVDETTDTSMLALQELADEVLSTEFPYPVTASHCVSLGMQDADRQRRVAEAVAAAGIAIVTLPQTNLYLQGRQTPCATPRGLTAVDALRASGVTVAGGGDNWRDPFNPMGRIDPMETASLLVTAGHQRVQSSYNAVSSQARRAMGLPEVRVAVGYPADLLAIRGTSLADAIADGSEHRIVIHAGRLLAHTEAVRVVDPRSYY